MKKFTKLVGLCPALFFLLSNLPTQLSAQTVAKRITASNGDSVAFLQYKPAGHDVPGNTRKYPLIIFLHGGGERNDNPSLVPAPPNASPAPVWKLRSYGPFRIITNNGHKMNFTWNGQVDSIMVLSPMSRKFRRLPPYSEILVWPPEYIDAIINYARDSLKVDTNRIYLTGHSYGGGGTFNYLNNSPANAKKFAAAAPVSAWNTSLNAAGYSNVSNAKLPLWGFHALEDSIATYTRTQNSINGVNALNPQVKALLTLWSDGIITPDPHSDAPQRLYDVIQFPYGWEGIINNYEWFLGQNKSLPVNILPVASVGSDLTISTTPGTATLNGSTSTDADGTIVRYVWKKISGPAGGTITTPLGSASSTTISGLTTAGVYKYQLNVVDNRAAIARDTLTITAVNGSGKAVTMTAASGRIQTGDVTELVNTSKFTLEAMIKYDTVNNYWTNIVRKNIDGNQLNRIMFHVGPGDNALYVFVNNGSHAQGKTVANAVSPGTWYHVAAVFDGTQTNNANRLKIYINGVLQTLTFSGTIPATTSSINTAPFIAGGDPICCTVGNIDEVRVWNTALSASTISEWKDKLLGSCHPNIANLIVYWPLNNSTNPAVATAELGTAYTGTITNASYLSNSVAVDTVPCPNKAVTMTAASGRIQTGDVTELVNTSKFTLEALIKYDTTNSNWSNIVRKNIDGNQLNRIMFHVGPGDNALYVFVNNGSHAQGKTVANAVSPGTWYHVAAVFDGTQTNNVNRLKIYINGVQQTLTFSGTIPATTSSINTAPFIAGGDPICCTVGNIDEVRVWNTALSASTIGEWKDKLLGSCHPDIANLIVYWPLDNNAAPSVAPAALGTTYTGTITNAGYITSNQAIASSGCSGARVSQLPSLNEVKGNKSFTGKIYPNPTDGFVQLEINASALRLVTVNVIDMSGRYLYRNKTSLIKGNNRIPLNITALPPGVYLIEVRDSHAAVEKFKVFKR